MGQVVRTGGTEDKMAQFGWRDGVRGKDAAFPRHGVRRLEKGLATRRESCKRHKGKPVAPRFIWLSRQFYFLDTTVPA
jgi:hypothetical protein